MSKNETAYRLLEKDIRESFAARKRLFIGLLGGTSCLLIIFFIVFWFIPYVGLRGLPQIFSWILGGIVLTGTILVIWSSAALVLNILLKKPIFFSKKLRGIAVKIFLPLMIIVGRLVGISKERVRASFIQVNNEMVTAQGGNYRAHEILLLMPHCLQNSLCRHRLTYNINNCKRCGECDIAGLLELSDEKGIPLAIATGGTIARRIVVTNKPKLIIAVACERDLASGIQDTYPLPVYGILNQRPHGPCLDTCVALNTVRQTIERFLQ